MERAWVLAEAVGASGASPSNVSCRGADGGLHRSSREGGNRGGRGAACGLQRVTEQMVTVPMLQLRRETVLVFQPVLVQRVKGRVADQRVDIPVFSVMDEIVAVAQEVVRLVPTETRATMDPRAFCGCAISSDFGGDCRGGEVGPTGTRAAAGSTSKLWRCPVHRFRRTSSES